MVDHNPVGTNWARRIIRSVLFTENLRGDNVRRTSNSIYIGSDGGKAKQGIYVPTRRWARVTGLLSNPGRYSGYEVVRGQTQDLTPFDEKSRGVTFGEDIPLYERNELPVSNIYTVVPIDLVRVNGSYRYEFDSPSAGGFWAQITGSGGSNNKFTYDFTQKVRTIDGWEEPENAWTGEVAINSREANNSAAGIQGNGVDLDGDIFTDNSGLGFQAIRGNPIVWIKAEPVPTGGFAYTLGASNAIDGTCG